MSGSWFWLPLHFFVAGFLCSLCSLLFTCPCFPVLRLPDPRDRTCPLGPSLPLRRHLLDAVGPLGGQVVLLGAVAVDVVQFPRAGRALGDELPVPGTDR